jgi:hypothetical protein
MENSINQLIEKYFNGETSLTEETSLKKYFNSGAVSEDLKQYEPLFQYFEEEKERVLTDDFDQKLFEKIGGAGKVIQMRSTRMVYLRVAAAVVFLIASFFLFQNIDGTIAEPEPIVWEQYEPETTEEAYEETKKALRLLAMTLNKGTKKAANEVSKMEKINPYSN